MPLIALPALTGATGLTNSWSLLKAPADLVATDYGQALLLKAGLFGAMLVIVAVNRFHLTLALPAPATRRALVRNTMAETVLGLAVLRWWVRSRHCRPAATRTNQTARSRRTQPLSIYTAPTP